ncbi:FAD/NAD(P)-binding oxidoreductase [Acrocarpospora macrocephala]|uniref:Ferredoxin reductase n=1 Tax=Acrocarpospora macrocephala TaxID=150177 RepID=A0A5M3WSX3_9ACTN|nr:FAD-dependent oxidoreductase [Acrocarpospora macrocephala]GES11292.1 ferredoxin reductase [Acrocarpospora macrocephala]
MATSTSTLLVVGASLAGLRAVEAARREGFGGSITLIGDEAHLPYDRPPLSKGYLKDDRAADYFRSEHEIRAGLSVGLRLSTRATRLDPLAHEVHTADGDVLGYERLVVATGASPRSIPQLAAKPGAYTLRTVDDAARLRAAINPGGEVVIIGAGFIGSEIASSAREKGAHVTIVEAAPVPLVRAVGDQVGHALAGIHGRHGTRLLCGTTVEEVIGEERVTGLRLSDGETVPADVVVVGIGAAPATAWLRDSGIALHPVDGGVICDEYLRSSLTDVYAAGDVTYWPNGVLDLTMRLENWTNAADQGDRAALNALYPHRAAPFRTVPYFWSDWYGNRFQFAGTPLADEVVFAREDESRLVALYRRADRLTGAATVNEPRMIMKLRRLIADRGSWESAHELVRAVGAPTRQR